MVGFEIEGDWYGNWIAVQEIVHNGATYQFRQVEIEPMIYALLKETTNNNFGQRGSSERGITSPDCHKACPPQDPLAIP